MNIWIVYPECELCDGTGHITGGDEEQQCPRCRMHYAAKLAEQERQRHQRRYGRVLDA